MGVQELVKLNGVRIMAEPKEILRELFCLFPDLPYRSKDALIDLYIGIFELTIETIKDQKGGKYTRFINSSKKRIQSFTEIAEEQDRVWVLERIYNEILHLEGMGTLPGFGFASSYGDRLPGNSERQSIYTKQDRFPKVEKKHQNNQNSKIKINKPFNQEEKEMTLKRSQLVEAAKELNETLGLDPQIDTKPGKKNKYLQDMIVEAGSVVEPDDEFSEETWTVLETLNAASRSAEEGEEPEEKGEEEEAPEATHDDEGEQEEAERQEEEPEPEPEKPAKKTEPAESKKAEKSKKETPKEKPAKKTKGTGVIATIASLIEKSGKKGITKKEILETLQKDFPNKNPDSMSKTVNVQVPNRITKEKFPVEKLEGGRYRKA